VKVIDENSACLKKELYNAKTFALKGVQTIHRSTPLFQTPCITSESHAEL
jgi:hypothetical protein